SSGSINSTGGNPIQASTQLILSADTGIAVNTLAVSVGATNNTAGDISLTQAASPQQSLTTVGAGIRNLAPGGLVSATNLGDALTVTSGSPVSSPNGAITLAATDFSIQDTISSGTATTTLANSTPGTLIALGTNGAGVLGLSDGELDRVFAGTLH